MTNSFITHPTVDWKAFAKAKEARYAEDKARAEAWVKKHGKEIWWPNGIEQSLLESIGYWVEPKDQARRLCPDCQENELAPRERYCGKCSHLRRNEARNQARRAKAGGRPRAVSTVKLKRAA